MQKKNAVTIKNVAQTLLQRALIDQEQLQQINVKAEAQTQRLAGAQQAGYSRRLTQTPEKASPAEVKLLAIEAAAATSAVTTTARYLR